MSTFLIFGILWAIVIACLMVADGRAGTGGSR